MCLGALFCDAEGHGCYDPVHGRVDVTKDADCIWLKRIS